MADKLLKLCPRCKRPLADHTRSELKQCYPSLRDQGMRRTRQQ